MPWDAEELTPRELEIFMEGRLEAEAREYDRLGVLIYRVMNLLGHKVSIEKVLGRQPSGKKRTKEDVEEEKAFLENISGLP
jgi:hypothetical protein